MSGICGVINLDGAPVEPRVLKKMARAAAHRGPDGVSYHTEGAIGLAHLALNITP
jgi:asparagine synthase (glutamine-hydrolysing)